MLNDMTEINQNQYVYLLLHGHDKLLDIVQSRLIELGFNKKQIINADPRKFAGVGDYIAQVWWPDEPTRLLVGKISKVGSISPLKAGDGELNHVQHDPIFDVELFNKKLE